MTTNQKVLLFLVDDDLLYLRSLEIDFMEQADVTIRSFASGELCIAALHEQPDIIILDYILDGVEKNAMNGIEVLDKIKAFDPEIPVIMLSAQDKIEIAVDCMHHQAHDYVVKSETAFLRLRKIITAIFVKRKMEKQLNWYMDRM
jgi:DNA-binding NtrC family response regulator